MMKNAVRGLVILLVCCVLFTGCSNSNIIEPETVHVSADGQVVAEAKRISLKNSGIKSLYETKLFYMEMTESRGFEYYVYDFETSKNKKVRTLRNVVVQDGWDALVGDRFYFSVHSGKRVLYKLDFSEETIEKVSSSPYEGSWITGFNGQPLALRNRDSDDGTRETYIMSIADNGECEEIFWLHTGSAEENISPYILAMTGDGEYLCTVEKETADSGEQYYFAKYNADFTLVQKTDITKLFEEYGLNSASWFYVCGDWLYLRDSSQNAVLCEVKETDISVCLSGQDIAYIQNVSENTPDKILLLRPWTNEIYILDTKTGELQSKTLAFEGDSYTITYALANEDGLCVKTKPIERKEGDTEYMYWIPLQAE